MGVHRVLEILADSGETRILIDEKSDTFIDIHCDSTAAGFQAGITASQSLFDAVDYL